jgi:hypothetical protein
MVWPLPQGRCQIKRFTVMSETSSRNVSNHAVPYKTEKMSTEEAWNKTYTLLRDIHSHFEKFNDLKSMTHTVISGNGFYARYSLTTTNEVAKLDKTQQFSTDQMLIETGLKKLEQEIPNSTERLLFSPKSSS